VRIPNRINVDLIRFTARVCSRTSVSRSRVGRRASFSATVGIAAMLQCFGSPRSQPRTARWGGRLLVPSRALAHLHSASEWTGRGRPRRRTCRAVAADMPTTKAPRQAHGGRRHAGAHECRLQSSPSRPTWQRQHRNRFAWRFQPLRSSAACQGDGFDDTGLMADNRAMTLDLMRDNRIHLVVSHGLPAGQ
jgi:hypothetical protein